MQVGKSYLIFLDKKIDNSDIYIKPDEFLIKPVFCYEKIENKPCKVVSKGQSSSPYEIVAKNRLEVGLYNIIDYFCIQISNYK